MAVMSLTNSRHVLLHAVDFMGITQRWSRLVWGMLAGARGLREADRRGERTREKARGGLPGAFSNMVGMRGSNLRPLLEAGALAIEEGAELTVAAASGGEWF